MQSHQCLNICTQNKWYFRLSPGPGSTSEGILRFWRRDMDFRGGQLQGWGHADSSKVRFIAWCSFYWSSNELPPRLLPAWPLYTKGCSALGEARWVHIEMPFLHSLKTSSFGINSLPIYLMAPFPFSFSRELIILPAQSIPCIASSCKA